MKITSSCSADFSLSDGRKICVLEASVSVLHAIPVGDDVWGCRAVRDRRSPKLNRLVLCDMNMKREENSAIL